MGLFEIIDGRLSQYWELRVDEQGNLTLWPPSFYQPYYHDDLSNFVPEVVEDFRRVRKLLEEEAATETTASSPEDSLAVNGE